MNNNLTFKIWTAVAVSFVAKISTFAVMLIKVQCKYVLFFYYVCIVENYN